MPQKNWNRSNTTQVYISCKTHHQLQVTNSDNESTLNRDDRHEEIVTRAIPDIVVAYDGRIASSKTREKVTFAIELPYLATENKEAGKP